MSTATAASTETVARHNLPLRLTSFIGREHEIGEVEALLGSHRLVTLVGAPGVGKTRLGLQSALAVRDAFSDGVWLVELAPLAVGNAHCNAHERNDEPLS